jgi:hypothetical protein
MCRQLSTLKGGSGCLSWFGLFGYALYAFAVSICNNSYVFICWILGVALCCFCQFYATLIVLPSCWLLALLSCKCHG